MSDQEKRNLIPTNDSAELMSMSESVNGPIQENIFVILNDSRPEITFQYGFATAANLSWGFDFPGENLEFSQRPHV